MEIGVAERGYKTVELRCGSDSMTVHLETDKDFFGVIYTKGSFHDRGPPCFLDPGNRTGQKVFTVKIPFEKCNTKQESNIYSNVLVLQYDKELIMPGDAAFHLECDFSKPREILVSADFNSADAVLSRIMPVDADPSKMLKKEDKKGIFESYTSSVIITPEKVRRRNEEL